MFENYKIKKWLRPRKEFVAKNKAAFLAVFDAAHPEATGKRTHGFTALAKVFVAFGALVAIFAGMSVYADTANVAADSPLYPLKRLSENVQLAIAPSGEKAQLQAIFAARRADEITALKVTNPSSTVIAGLTNDLNADVDASLSDAQSANVQDGSLHKLCDKVFSALATSSLQASDDGLGTINVRPRVRVIGKFLNQCGESMNTSTVNIEIHASSSASSTTTGVAGVKMIRLDEGDRRSSVDVTSSAVVSGDAGDSSATINILNRWQQLLGR